MFARSIVPLIFVLSASSTVRSQDLSTMGGLTGGSFYDGPAILGRGGYGVGIRGFERVPIHLNAAVNATYDSTLLGFSVDSSGEFRPVPSYGVEGILTASGQKRWRTAYLGLGYGGNYAHYAKNTSFNGSNHNLNLGYGARLGRSFEFFTNTGAGTSNRFVGSVGPFQNDAFEFFAIPQSELFDSRTYFIGNSTGLTYFLDRYNSVRLSGTGSAIRRRARALADVTTYGASADWVRQVGRRVSIGASYTFTHYDFSRVFGESDLHLVGIHLSRKFGRTWELQASATGIRQSTVGVRQFDLDPVLAALLGRGTGTEVFESNNLLYGFSAELRKTVRRSQFSIRAERGVVPGNGFFLTSINENGSASAHHTVSERLQLNATAVYSRYSSLGFAAGQFRGWSSGAGGSYRLTRTLGTTFRYDWRQFNLTQTTFSRSGTRITLGLTYSPTGNVWGMW